MKKIAMLSSAVALCFVTATAVLSQMDTMPKDAENTTVTGKVVSTSGSTLVIETDTGTRMTFDTTGTTLPSAASMGTRIQIAYAPNQTGGVTRLSTVRLAPVTDTAIADAKYHTTGSAGTVGASVPADMYASNRNLPKTASLLPLVGLLGVLALGAGFAVRFVRSAF